MSVRYSYAPSFPQLKQLPRKDQTVDSSTNSISPANSKYIREDATSRDLRVFGGVPEDQHELADLRGPMLDVVLGLFNGIDYDDEAC